MQEWHKRPFSKMARIFDLANSASSQEPEVSEGSLAACTGVASAAMVVAWLLSVHLLQPTLSATK